MLLKSIDIIISDLFVKYQRHHSKTTKLRVEAPLIYTSGEVKALPFYRGDGGTVDIGAQWSYLFFQILN